MDWFDRPLYRWVSYIVFTLVAFVLALVATFPDGQVKRIAAVQIEHRLEKSMKKGYVVTVSDLDPWWIGIELEGLKIEERATSDSEAGAPGSAGSTAGAPKGKAKGKATKAGAGGGPAKTSIEIPSIGARFAPLGSILNGGLAARFHLGMGGGSIGGTFTQASGARYLSVGIEELQLDDSPLLEQLTGIPMFGRLDGAGEFTLSGGRPTLKDGSFELRGSKVTVGPKPKLKIEALPVGHVSVPQVNFGNLELKLHVERPEGSRPKLVVDRFKSQGRDLRLQIWGGVKLGGRGATLEQLQTRVQFDPQFAQKNQSIQALQRHQKLQNGQSGKWYGLIFWGPVSNLQWKGSPTAARGPQSKGAGGGTGAPGKGG